MRILIIGNSGAGKTTLARAYASEHGIAHLDLDAHAWDPGPVRRSLEQSREAIDDFLSRNDRWVVEGSYGDLAELVLPRSPELIFLNPGVEACVRNCLARPWEPEKYSSREEQDEKLGFLIEWVRSYETRDDEFSLLRHRRIFDRYEGPKREVGPGVE